MKRAVSFIFLKKLRRAHAYTKSFSSGKSPIAHLKKRAHRYESKRMCIYTDARDTQWSGILKNVFRYHLNLPHHEMGQDPFAFDPGRFTKLQFVFFTFEKEAFAVLSKTEHPHWMALCADGFDLHNNHNNLIFIFNCLAVRSNLGKVAI